MFAAFFIDRPIFSWVISIVIVTIGLVSVFVLPIAQYPDITPPTVTVTASYPGANAETVANSVAAPIEQQISGVDNMLYMSSQCTNDGAYTLTVTFALKTDPNMNQVLVQNRVSLAMPQLPQEVQVQGVTTKKRSPSILLVVNLISPDGTYDDLFLSNYATIQVKDELLRVKGVGDINFLGQRDYSLRIWLDPEKMASRNLSASDVLNAVKAQNVQVAAGQIGREPVPSGQLFQLTMSTLGRLEDVEQFADILIKSGPSDEETTSTPVVRLKDVARVELGAQQYDQMARLSGQPTVGVSCYQLPGSNALEVATGIRAKMEEIKKRFPKGIEYRIVYDTTPFVKQSIEEVFSALVDAVLLVAIVVLLFLQDWKAMILPMIDVPVSLIGAFAVMAALGFSLNNLTLFGLVLAIGIVVDDAIMVLENIERLIGTGLDARTATIQSMSEITGPIIAVTLVLISVFLPAAFLPGITGKFYQQFALTIAATMVISALNAMTLTPSRAVGIFKTEEGAHGGHEHLREALPWWIFGLIGAYLTHRFGYGLISSLLQLPAKDTAEALLTPAWKFRLATGLAVLPGLIGGLLLGKVIIKPVNLALGSFFRAFNSVFTAITLLYGKSIAGVVRVSLMVLLLYGGLLLLTGYTMVKAPKGFIPEQDQGYLLVNVQLPDSASVQRTQEVMTKIERIVLGDEEGGKYRGKPAPKGEKRYKGVPGIANTVSIAGQSFLLNANGSNFGSCFLVLDSFEKRAGHHEMYDAEVLHEVQNLFREELDVVVSVFRAPPIQGLGNAGGFQLQTEQRGFVDLKELQDSTDRFVVAARKDPKLAGVFTMYRASTPQLYVDIDRTKCESLGLNFQDVFNTLQVYMGGAYVNLFNKFGRTWQVNIQAESKFRTDQNSLKGLKVRNKEGEMVPLASVAEVKDVTGPVLVMRYNMYTSAPVNGAPAPGVSSGQAIAALNELARKENLPIEWTQITFLQLAEGSGAIFAFLVGTLLIYMVLAAQYESWSLPLAIILVVPMCLLCSVVGMLIARMPVDIFVQIGFLVLVGLAAKNAILIVEFAHHNQKQGMTRHEAIVESCRLRLRPIIMTSFAFILGVVPLVLGHGAGAEMRKSLGLGVFSGMVGVTFFGLFLTPVFYYSIMYLSERKKPAPRPSFAHQDGAMPPLPPEAPRPASATPSEGIQTKETHGS